MSFKVCLFYIALCQISSFPIVFAEYFIRCEFFGTSSMKFDCGALPKTIKHEEVFNSYSNNNSSSIYYCNGYSAHISRVIGTAYQVDFKNCQLPKIPQKFFQQLRLSKDIRLDNSGVLAIENELFSANSELKGLSMSHNNITELSASVFSNTQKMEDLNFSYNKITKIDAKIFILPKLETLKFSHNLVETLDEKLFETTTELREIDFSYNQLETFLPEMMNLKWLTSLNLNNNRIVQLKCNAFPNRSKFELMFIRAMPESTLHTTIDVSDNRLKAIDLNCEKSSKRLVLNVDNNLLEDLTLPGSTLGGNLERVLASKNKIKTIHIENELNGLTWLKVANNCLTNITDIFKYCGSLTTLDLSFNNLGSLGANSFVKLTKLENLHLNSINLSELEYGTLSHSRNLKFLDLSHNKLNEFDFGLFLPSFDDLMGLFLNNNNITDFLGWTNSILPNLNLLGISSNNLNCSYLMRFLHGFSSTSVQLLPDTTLSSHDDNRTNINGITCMNPKSGKNRINENSKAIVEKSMQNEGDSLNKRSEFEDAVISITNNSTKSAISAEQNVLCQSSGGIFQAFKESLISAACFAVVLMVFIKLSSMLYGKRQSHRKQRHSEQENEYDLQQSSTTLIM